MKNLKSNPLISIGKLLIFVVLFFSTEKSLAQKNNLKFLIYTDYKFSFEFEQSLSPTSSFLLGYKTKNIRRFSESPSAIKRNDFHDYSERSFIVSYRKYFFSKSQKHLSGFYFAPNASVGVRNIIHGQPYSSDGEGCNVVTFCYGQEKIKALGLGLNLGIQHISKKISIDFGVNITKNFVLGDQQEVLYSYGKIEKFKAEIIGFSPEIYGGIGFPF